MSATPEPEPTRPGAPTSANRALRGLVTVLVAVIVWFSPMPDGVQERAWHLLAIFVATIVALILQPLPMGSLVLIATTTTMVTHTLVPAEAMAGYMNTTVWLIVAAFLFARAFGKTGLGRRIAYVFIRKFGSRTLGLGYALALTDLVLAPGIPSGTARTGGVLFPVVKSLAQTYGSEPGPTAGRIGTFLMLSVYQVHAITSAMFLTAMVANPLMVELARETVGIEITWIGWASAAIVPGLISVAILPYLVFRMTRPEIRETPGAAELARVELAKMGPMSRPERVVSGVFVMVFVLWVTGTKTGLEPTVVALLGLCAMLILGALKWEDVLAERAGWDALIWFGGLVGMATMLNTLGLIPWFSRVVGGRVEGWPWLPTLGILTLVYLYSHYFFATLTAHATAFFVPFLTVAVAAGAPPYLAALTFAFFTSLCASLTHYAGGPSVIYFGAGYSSIRQWWTMGLIASLLSVVVWMGIGSFWWKALGLF
ncbi:MAG: anion permease [Gemmatimonadetes bacterium]|nr:anion permease [Gemmatimonadota bacterium]